MIRKLRIKFICINMTIITAMLLVIFGMLLHFTRDNLEQQSLEVMMGIQEEPFAPEPPGVPPMKRIQLPWFRVSWDPGGGNRHIFGTYAEQLEEETLEQVIVLARESDQQMGVLKQYSLRFRKSQDPRGQKILFVDISSEMATMSDLMKTSAFVGGLSFIGFLVLNILLARWAVRPVEEAWNLQKQFVADASHELKTPLTVIMTNAELLREDQYDQRDKQVFAGNILTMSRQMRYLVERLLDLAKVDNGTAKMEFVPLDFSALVAESILPFEPVYFERQLRLESELEQGLRIKGSETHLKQVLEILLDNGAKYTAPEGTVCVRLQRQGGVCLLCVSGPGDPISRENLTNIFRRFYRIDKARSRDGSYGLGLSIAESILTAHGGKIWAASEAGINSFFVQISIL